MADAKRPTFPLVFKIVFYFLASFKSHAHFRYASCGKYCRGAGPIGSETMHVRPRALNGLDNLWPAKYQFAFCTRGLLIKSMLRNTQMDKIAVPCLPLASWLH